MKPQIGVIGNAGIEEYPSGTRLPNSVYTSAYQLGMRLGKEGWILVNGGKSGIMLESAKGCKAGGGTSVGVITGNTRGKANSYIDVEIVSGMYPASEESLLISICDLVVCIGGGAGTLQELAIAYRTSKPIILIKNTGGWADKLLDSAYLDQRKTQKLNVVSSVPDAIKKIKQILVKQGVIE